LYNNLSSHISIFLLKMMLEDLLTLSDKHLNIDFHILSSYLEHRIV
jgi:hypothetical protein